MSALSTLFWTGFHRSDASAGFRWALALGATLGLTAALGTVAGILYYGCGLVALVYLFMAPANYLPLTPREKLIAAIYFAYLGVTLFCGLIADNPLYSFGSLYANIGFALAVPLLPVLRQARRDYWDIGFRLALAAGGIVAGIGAVVEIWLIGPGRAELLSGNALVFAYLTGCGVLMNGCLAAYSTGRLSMLNIAGALGSAVGLLLSGSRGPIVVVILLSAVGLVASLAIPNGQNRRRIVVGSGIVIFAAVVVLKLASETAAGQALFERFYVLWETLREPDSSGGTYSYTERMGLWKSGFAAFMEHPLLGFGRQNIMEAVNQFAPAGKTFEYTHLHNAILTEAVASGVLGAVTYLGVLLTPVIAARGNSAGWRAAALLFAIFTATCALTNIGFYHDIMVAYFCTVVMVVASTAPDTSMVDRKTASDYAHWIRSRHAGRA